MKTALKLVLMSSALWTVMISALGMPFVTYGVSPQGFDEGIERTRQQATDSGLKDVDLKTAIENVITFILSLVGVIAVLAVIIGGLMYIASIGDESRAERAKKILLYAIIGLVVVGLSLTIVNFVIGLI